MGSNSRQWLVATPVEVLSRLSEPAETIHTLPRLSSANVWFMSDEMPLLSEKCLKRIVSQSSGPGSIISVPPPEVAMKILWPLVFRISITKLLFSVVGLSGRRLLTWNRIFS